MEAVALSTIRNTNLPIEEKKILIKKEQIRLAIEDGKICFDLFAYFSEKILSGCNKIRKIFSGAFPVIILDEFQDTNLDQWKLVIQLGRYSKLIALADPKQRIYGFLGADPERINNFRHMFTPTEFDISDENHRNKDTEIAMFGNDLLTGNFRAEYKGIKIKPYHPNQNQAYASLKYTVLHAIKRLHMINKGNWSLAVLVPTKKMMHNVSEALTTGSESLPSIHNHAMIDMEGVVLSAEIIAFLMQSHRKF